MNRTKVIQILDNFDFRDFQYIYGTGGSLPLLLDNVDKLLQPSTKKLDKSLNTQKTDKKGEFTEKYFYNILSLFNFDNILSTPRESILDCDYKVDILGLCNNFYLTFQVKSSKYYCEQSLQLDQFVRPIYVVYDSKHRNILFDELTYFLSILGIGLNSEYYEALKYLDVVKKLKDIPFKELSRFEVIDSKITKYLNILYCAGKIYKSNYSFFIP
jgi:hypothetical protein